MRAAVAGWYFDRPPTDTSRVTLCQSGNDFSASGPAKSTADDPAAPVAEIASVLGVLGGRDHCQGGVLLEGSCDGATIESESASAPTIAVIDESKRRRNRSSRDSNSATGETADADEQRGQRGDLGDVECDRCMGGHSSLRVRSGDRRDAPHDTTGPQQRGDEGAVRVIVTPEIRAESEDRADHGERHRDSDRASDRPVPAARHATRQATPIAAQAMTIVGTEPPVPNHPVPTTRPLGRHGYAATSRGYSAMAAVAASTTTRYAVRVRRSSTAGSSPMTPSPRDAPEAARRPIVSRPNLATPIDGVVDFRDAGPRRRVDVMNVGGFAVALKSVALAALSLMLTVAGCAHDAGRRSPPRRPDGDGDSQAPSDQPTPAT